MWRGVWSWGQFLAVPGCMEALAWALGIVLALLSFRESSTIDGDST